MCAYPHVILITTEPLVSFVY